MKAIEETYQYQTEIILSLLANYPDYFFICSEPNSFFGFNNNDKSIEELKQLESLEGLSAEAKRKIEKIVKKAILSFENLKLASFSIERMMPDCDTWLYSKDLFLDGVTEDLIFLKNKKKFFKKDYLIREIIISIISLYAFHFGLVSIGFELEVLLKEAGYWEELEDCYGVDGNEDDEDKSDDEYDW